MEKNPRTGDLCKIKYETLGTVFKAGDFVLIYEDFIELNESHVLNYKEIDQVLETESLEVIVKDFTKKVKLLKEIK